MVALCTDKVYLNPYVHMYQVSGLKFTFDPELPCGNRIVRESVYVAGEILQPNKVFITYS